MLLIPLSYIPRGCRRRRHNHHDGSELDWQGSNLRPPASEAGALSPELQSKRQRVQPIPLVGMTRFELAALRSQSGCATKLRHTPRPRSSFPLEWPTHTLTQLGRKRQAGPVRVGERG